MIILKDVSKVYDLGKTEVVALKDINLSISKGEFITIMGPSGCGKSSLLHILGILDQPQTGTYTLEGYEITTLSDKELSRIRNRHFGFVFQSFNLFPEFNALENVTIPLMYAGISTKRRKERAIELLSSMGLENRMYHYPNMLSGGEQQRVAIARALANDPSLILADEPTGNLSSKMGTKILNIFCGLNEKNVTIIMVTHDKNIGRYGNRMICLKDGQIISDKRVKDRIDPAKKVTGKKI